MRNQKVSEALKTLRKLKSKNPAKFFDISPFIYLIAKQK